MEKLHIKSIIFLSFFLILISCNLFHKGSSSVAKIEGKIAPHLNRNKVIYFYRYTDSLSLFLCKKVATDSCIMNPDGSFKLEIKNWDKPGFFNLGTNEYEIARHYFLSPGDHINLYYEGNEMPLKLSTYQNIGEYNKFLQIYADTFYREPATKRTYFVISNFLMAPDYANYINERRQKQLAFYQNYFEGKEIDSTFKYYFEKETDFNWANDKTYFLWKKRTRQEFKPVDTSYFDFLQVINSDDPKALIAPAYPRFIELYLNELYQEVIFNIPINTPQAWEKCVLANQYLTGTGRKIAFHQILRDETSGVGLNILQRDPKERTLLDSMITFAVKSTSDSAFYNYRFIQK